MKTSILFAFILFCSCSKEQTHTVTEIELATLPLDSIKMYIRGNWKLAYIKGGWNPYLVSYRKENYMTIFPNDSISWTEKQAIIARSKITFGRIKYNNTDSIFTILFTDYNSTGTTSLYALKKRNDTLILKSTFTEPASYYFVPR
jgi:hypothetical protein